jgi:carbonic anhydrase
MKNILLYTNIALGFLIVVPACHNKSKDQRQTATSISTHEAAAAPTTVRRSVLTSADQELLTADEVIQLLKEGNQKYQHNQLTFKNDTAMMQETIQGQYPEAFVLSCIDSRVPVEAVFDRGIGDLFVGRLAGNVVDEDMLASMEYACKVSGSKLIVVLGHESCGAVKAAIEGEKLGNITHLLTLIQPAIQRSQHVAGEHSAKNPAYVAAVVEENIRNSIAVIQSKSPVLKEMVDKGVIKIVGANYSLHTGAVSFLNDRN